MFRNSLKTSVMLAACALFLGAAAFAQQYQIISADYGAGNQRVDVTQKLQQIAASNRTFRMGNSTFGVDPAPGQVKTLRIFARDARNGGTRTFEYREGATVDGAQFSGWNGGGGGYWGNLPGRPGEQYQIMRADYGVGNRRVDVTQKLQQIANTNQTFRMGNSTFGVDPAPGQVKSLRIFARSPRGQNRTFEYPENALVDGALFTGWSGGSWGGGGANNQYVILRADYGAGNRRADVTQRLQQIASSNRSFRMGNDTFGMDPAPGQVKTLRIYARAQRGGGNRTFEYREGSVVDGAQFTGWSAGNWGNIPR